MTQAAAAELIARFDAAVPDQWEPHAAPTAESLARIEAELSCRLPPLLVEFATRSRSFSSFFLGLGPDYGWHSHILEKNRFIRIDADWLREANGVPAPAHLVFITENHTDDYLWCLDARVGANSPIVFWSPDGRDVPAHPTFEDFIRSQVEFYEAKQRRRTPHRGPGPP